MTVYNALKEAAARLPEYQRNKAESLIAYMDSRKSWSDKQVAFAQSLIKQADEIAERAALVAANKADEAPAPRFARIVGIFANAMQRAGRDAAKDSLKRPALHLITRNSLRFSAKLSGASSKYPGHIQIAAKEFGAGYWGRIDTNGAWFPARQQSDSGAQALADVESALDAIENDARGALNVQSAKIGVCACCGRMLTDKHSVERGVGPVCAERWGL